MNSQLPLIVETSEKKDIGTWLEANRNGLDSTLDQHGAILLRGFDMSREEDFKTCVAQFSKNVLKYVYRSTPRTDLGNGIYTATEYPSGLDIPLHNENAYQRAWPLHLLFFCMSPAQGGGGQTPLASTTKVTNRINTATKAKFLQKQVMYTRNYRRDIDLPWQTVFQTQSSKEVEAYCRSQQIDFEWTSHDHLRTRQICKAFARHPRNGVLLWFNQAHLFHPSSLDSNRRELMAEMFKTDELPRYACYGDGTPIEEEDLDNIREAFREETVLFEWRAGDTLIVDNMLVSHGRTSYRGHRRVLAAMCNVFSPM